MSATNCSLPSRRLAILNKQAQIMIKAGAELGFSRASRTRVQVSPSFGGNAFARLRGNPFGPKPWEFGIDNRDGLLAEPAGSGGEEDDGPDEFFGD